jgi:hypothetical protein
MIIQVEYKVYGDIRICWIDVRLVKNIINYECF